MIKQGMLVLDACKRCLTTEVQATISAINMDHVIIPGRWHPIGRY